ncbi:MAG: sugar ABC transporter ATP-binding protein [Ancalomicrobiaceae bacterium]|nr:sugar ABC transporter ATP-binding protein [Ancalomicrobiaceae bacterium]
MSNFLQLRNIYKSFVGVRALKGVDFSVRAGEVHCLVGENGSGKSTLIKIISGVQPADSGELLIDGVGITHATPNEMIHRGIQVIYQDLSLLPNLSVAENIAISQIAMIGRKLIRWSEIRAIARAAMARVKIDIDLDKIVGDLPVGLQQMVAICRAFTSDLKLLVLDEPTSSLTKAEIDNLLKVVRDMQANGIAVLFISHKLNEVLAIADRVTGLRDGCTVGTVPRAETNLEKLTEMITGKAVVHTRFHLPAQPRKKLLEVRNLSKKHNFADISFDLYEGEILGIAGLIGAGRTELALALFGISPADSGTITVDGQERRIGSVQDAVEAGFAYVPENRLTQGLVLKRSVGDNIAMAMIDKCANAWGMIDRGRRTGLIDTWVRSLAIKVANADVAVQTLSGGNQQRVVIGKWLATEPKVLILDGPTVGVDIAAKSSIHQIVRDYAARGTGVILISDEVPEVAINSNRVLIMRNGRLRSEVNAEAVGTDEIQRMVEIG